MKLQISPIARSLALAFGGLAAALPASQVFAQQQQQLERVEITGSRIRRVDAESSAPVQTITREDIERTGKTSIQDVLRTVTADSNGTIPTSFTNGFAGGSAAVSLRGLGVNSTLVLVNGRRMSTYGLADDGTRNFVDLNSLPLEAVDRIEILKDGASAIYGADAVGGVVNVILRRNYTGASIGGSYGQTGDGDGQDLRVYGSYGFGNLDTDKYNVFFTLEASSTDNIWSKDRGFIGETDFRYRGYYDVTNGAPRPYFGLATPSANSPYGVTRNAAGGGARVNMIPCNPGPTDPTTGLCRYNRLDEQEVQPETDRLNLYGRGTMQLSPTLTGYAELGYFQTKTKAAGTLGANNDGGVYVPGDPFNPLLVHGPMTLPAGHPDNTFGVNRTLFYVPYELGGRDQETDNKVFRGLIGLSGSNYGWDWDSGLLYVKSTLQNDNFGFIIYNEMQAALNNGTYRITRPGLTSPSPTDPAVLARVSPTLSSEPTSSVTSLDFKASRELMPLAGGALGLALGAEIRREEAEDPGVPGTETGSIVGLGYSKFSMKRDIYALYGEVVAPVAKWLELNAALRYDHYSDFGGNLAPKLGFKIRPNDQFLIRGTYSEAFRAPGAAEVGGSSFGFTTFGILSQGNPDIQPEEAKSYTLGVVWEPMAGTSFTLDYWKIDRENEILQADPNTIIGNLPSTGTPNSRINGALPGTFIYYGVDGNIATVTGFYRNASDTSTDGFDFSATHRMSLQDYGRLSGQLFWTHVNSLERTDEFGNTFEYAGTHGPLVQSSGTGAPKDRVTASLTWDRGPFALTLALNYTSSIKMVDNEAEISDTDGTEIINANTGVHYPDNGSGNLNCGVFDTQGNVWNGNCKLPSFTTFDLFAKWSPTKNWDINFSVQNLFGKEAPFDPYLILTYGINYNQAYHQSGAVGRFYTIGARYRF
jgi:iron complex outermembrane receptor protein